MRLMHTRLPDFYQKVQDAGKRRRPETEVTVSGLEGFQTGKLASLRVGRVENEIYEVTEDPSIAKVEVIAVPKVSETAHTIIIKGYTKDGTCKKAVLENMYVNSVGEDYFLLDAEEVDDRRANPGWKDGVWVNTHK